ncbi:protein kinase [bacterium]|nr:protein kinase [bacterium]
MTGKIISHYKILKELGRGGMGVVYKAEDTKLKRSVALKFLHTSATKDKSGKLIGAHNDVPLQTEAQGAASVNHTNVCTIYEINKADGHIFIAMEYVQGRTLKDIVGAHGHVPQSIDAIIDYATQIAQGLQAIHEKGMVHRDIKSENILITDKGQVKIMDFGLVKSMSVKDRVTDQDSSGGTVAYMSPEQIRGESIDHRSDIWSFGVVLYEMLIGSLPFTGKNVYAMIDSILNEEPESMTGLRMDIPEVLERMTYRALGKKKEDRFQDVQEILADLKKSQKFIESIPLNEKTASKKTKPSIAVLPFINMSADPEQEYFCDGITEEIINALTNIGSLHVVARTSAFFFKGKDVKLRDIGKELNVETVLEGSVRKSGRRLRITAQLINVENDYHIWSEKYDRELEDIFEIQDDISLAIAEALKIRLLNKEKAAVIKRHTDNHQAYELYLKGNYFWNQRSEEGYHKAIECFQKAIEKDPNYARAYVGIAKCYWALGLYFIDPDVALPKTVEAANKALEIDDKIGEAYVAASNSCLFSFDWKESIKQCKRAIVMDLQDIYTYHCYSNTLALIGKHDEAISVIKQALELDPLSLNMNSVAGFLLLFARRFDEAIEKFHKILEIDPDFQHSLMYLGITYIAKTMIEEAIDTFHKFYSLSEESPLATGLLGYAYARAGRKKDALQLLTQLTNLSESRHVLSLHRALIYLGLGEYNQTFEYLEKSYKKHEILFPFLSSISIFDPIRKDPRYIILMKKMNLEK